MLLIASPAMAPYKHVCKKCIISNFIVVEKGFYSNIYHCPQPIIKQAYFNFPKYYYVSLRPMASNACLDVRGTIFESFTRV
jgi:hypothetical protein